MLAVVVLKVGGVVVVMAVRKIVAAAVSLPGWRWWRWWWRSWRWWRWWR